MWLLALNTGRGHRRARICISPRPGRNGLGAVLIGLFLRLDEPPHGTRQGAAREGECRSGRRGPTSPRAGGSRAHRLRRASGGRAPCRGHRSPPCEAAGGGRGHGAFSLKRNAPVEAGARAVGAGQAASACAGSSVMASASSGASSCSCEDCGVSASKIAGIQPVPFASRSASLAMSAFFNFASRLT